jgi:hypothetical protein
MNSFVFSLSTSTSLDLFLLPVASGLKRLLEPLQMRAAGRNPGGLGEWNKVQKGQKSTWASCCLSTSPQKPPIPNLCHWQYNACHIGSYFIHSTPCRIVLHPSILSSCLSHVKQHVFLRPITCLPEIEHPVRIHCTLPASAHVKSPLVANWC